MHRSTRNTAMCSLNDAINLPVSLRPRLLTLGRCHGTSGTRSQCAGVSEGQEMC